MADTAAPAKEHADKPAPPKLLDQEVVELLDAVVTLLVVAIDGPLDFGNPGIAHVRAAGNIFLVPEQVVELVPLRASKSQLPLGRMMRISEKWTGPKVEGSSDNGCNRLFSS